MVRCEPRWPAVGESWAASMSCERKAVGMQSRGWSGGVVLRTRRSCWSSSDRDCARASTADATGAAGCVPNRSSSRVGPSRGSAI